MLIRFTPHKTYLHHLFIWKLIS